MEQSDHVQTRAGSRPRARQHEILHGLIRQRGLRADEYTLFFVSGEGQYLPISQPDKEVEETSGYVLNRQGHVFSFWFGWDRHVRAPALTEWEPVEPEPHWRQSAEYRRARERLGLSPA
jgi:hypothetical protein